MNLAQQISQNQKEFETNILDIFGPDGGQWLKGLPSLVCDLERDWRFKVQSVIPHLTYSFVAVVDSLDGKTAILKLSPPNPRCDSEIAWYQANCIVAPILFKNDSGRGAMLMEHVRPGYSAKKWVIEGKDIDATRAIAEVIRSLQPSFRDSSKFKSVSQLAKNLDKLEGKIDSRLLSKAKSLFQELSKDSSSHRILHGDLHHGNVLWFNDKWVAIDPHGYFGPAAFEVGAMIRNPYECFPNNLPLKKVLNDRLAVLGEVLPFDRNEIRGWAFAYTMMSAAWSVIDHGEVPKSHIEICEILSDFSNIG